MDIAKHFKGSYGTMYYVRNMSVSVQYYIKHFGFKPVFESEHWAEFDIEGRRLCLHLAEPKMKNLPGGVMILSVERLGELYTKLSKSGVKFNGEPHKVHEEDYSVDYTDPDGNIVSFYGRMK